MADKKLYIKTYGCQMNVYDSLRMQDVMAPMGYSVTEEPEEADMIILNTCHIREKAAEKVYSELGRIKQIRQKRKNNYGKETIIAVAGCVSQAEGEEIFKRAPSVDIVVGPQSYHSLPDMVSKVMRDHKQVIELDFVEEEKFDVLPEEVTKQEISAFVSVQEGCDKFCHFCVVPYTRGAEFSRPVEQVIREVMQQVSHGAKEIVLLGQNVSSYHGQKPDGTECSFAELLARVAEIKGVERLRYTTSHPIDMDDELIDLHGREPKLMPFLHLPVQTGSDSMLKRMNRKHTRDMYFGLIDKFRASRPDIVFSSDFIVGYPGETEQDFWDTMDLVKRVGYGQCYSFKYSPRPGTPAASHQQVDDKIKQDRLQLLQAELAKQQFEYNKSCVGKTLPVLFDRYGKYEGQLLGKTPYMQSVHVNNAESYYGLIVDVKINEAYATSLSGEIADKPEDNLSSKASLQHGVRASV